MSTEQPKDHIRSYTLQTKKGDLLLSIKFLVHPVVTLDLAMLEEINE